MPFQFYRTIIKTILKLLEVQNTKEKSVVNISFEAKSKKKNKLL